jgi:spermidine synthase
MSAHFQVLDARQTPMGVISLRRRHDPVSDSEVYEAKLDDEFLMSSLFVAAEVEVARLALLELDGDELDVVVGGLGLGYTAHTVLSDPRVRSLVVIEALDAVIDWHSQHLLPLGQSLTTDPRCRLENGDFFALARGNSLDPQAPDHRFDAIVVDIDHSPRELLHPSHADFYQLDGVQHLAEHLRIGGVFSLWSNDPPDVQYEDLLAAVFADVRAEIVRFPSALPGQEASNTVYIAQAPVRTPG